MLPHHLKSLRRSGNPRERRLVPFHALLELRVQHNRKTDVQRINRGCLRADVVSSSGDGETAAANGIVLHELTAVQASLEEAFMELTREDVEIKAGPATATALDTGPG